ncbi:MAG: tyrosine-type recombinase/integrase [Bdellovibrionota bacterium]
MERRGAEKERLQVFYFLALFQIRTGVRIGEACALAWRDVDFQTGAVSISKTVQWSRSKGRKTCISPLTKTGRPRVIYITSQVASALRAWAAKSKRTVGLIFSFDGFAPLPYRSVQHHYDIAFERLELPWTSTHILRQSFARPEYAHMRKVLRALTLCL